MKTFSIKAKVDMEASPELQSACKDLSDILYPMHPAIEISALTTMVCRAAIMYDIPKEVFLNTLSEGYDAFKLMVADGPMQ